METEGNDSKLAEALAAVRAENQRAYESVSRDVQLDPIAFLTLRLNALTDFVVGKPGEYPALRDALELSYEQHVAAFLQDAQKQISRLKLTQGVSGPFGGHAGV